MGSKQKRTIPDDQKDKVVWLWDLNSDDAHVALCKHLNKAKEGIGVKCIYPSNDALTTAILQFTRKGDAARFLEHSRRISCGPCNEVFWNVICSVAKQFINTSNHNKNDIIQRAVRYNLVCDTKKTTIKISGLLSNIRKFEEYLVDSSTKESSLSHTKKTSKKQKKKNKKGRHKGNEDSLNESSALLGSDRAETKVFIDCSALIVPWVAKNFLSSKDGPVPKVAVDSLDALCKVEDDILALVNNKTGNPDFVNHLEREINSKIKTDVDDKEKHEKDVRTCWEKERSTNEKGKQRHGKRVPNPEESEYKRYDTAESMVPRFDVTPKQHHYSYATREGIQISIYSGDITEETVDVIVNAANSRLRHEGGVARALVKVGGYTIQQESDDFVSRNGELRQGTVCYTTGGKLGCDHIIHAVGPVWDPHNKGRCIEELEESLKGAFYCASNIVARSLATPIISSGLYGVPLEVCAKAFRATIDDFSRMEGGHTSLKDIRIVNNDAAAIERFILEYTNESSYRKPSKTGYHGHPGPVARDEERNHVRRRKGSSKKDISSTLVSIENVDVSSPSHPSREPDRYSSWQDGTDYKDASYVPVSSSLRSYSSSKKTFEEPRSLSTTRDLASPSRSVDLSVSTASSGPAATTASIASPAGRGDCAICVDDDVPLKTMKCCQNTICNDCFDRHFSTDAKCPFCTLVVLMKKGNQPHGSMIHRIDYGSSLPGYEGDGTIIIAYQFPSGIQEENHPHPGMPYAGTGRQAYLPANGEGREVFELLQRGFEQKILFTIGKSVTTGQDNCVIWNDVHHKTNTHGGPQRYGYPDPTYLSRVKAELAAKGIK